MISCLCLRPNSNPFSLKVDAETEEVVASMIEELFTLEFDACDEVAPEETKTVEHVVESLSNLIGSEDNSEEDQDAFVSGMVDLMESRDAFTGNSRDSIDRIFDVLDETPLG